MTEEAKLIVNTLRECAVATQCSKCVVFCGNSECLFTAAANMIESLSAELEQVKRERDAAVEDLKDFCSCHHCQHYKRDCNDKCYFVTGLKPDWQWRGVMSDE